MIEWQRDGGYFVQRQAFTAFGFIVRNAHVGGRWLVSCAEQFSMPPRLRMAVVDDFGRLVHVDEASGVPA